MTSTSPTGPVNLPDDDWLRRADRVAVHGLGREGRSVITDLGDANPDAAVVLLDDREPATNERAWLAGRGVDLVVGADRAVAAVVDVDLLVRSPGVPPSHPAQVAARHAGVPVTSALNLFFARARPDNVIAVTGTKGKSTTATLLGHLLDGAGRRVRVAGNVGVSVLDLDVRAGDLDHLVLELSSYQLTDLRGRPAIGVWLNLHRDHHAWHEGRDGYVRDKSRIAALSELLVANAADEEVVALVRDHPDLVTFDATGDPVDVGGTDVARGRLADALGRSALVGAHNLTNLAAALAVGGVVGLAPDDLMAGVADFTPLRHRLELVHDDGRRWVDDSIATIPEAAVAALAAFPDVPVTLLAGGFDRDQDHAPLLTALAQRARSSAAVRVVALPDTGHRLAAEVRAADRAAGNTVEVAEVDDLDRAVALAARTTARGGVVLLSPAAASFNQFRSFEERGDRFAALARHARPPG